eukprot:TRINITY_DN13660_c0_g1_i1.p1 TRINITY_DN13660_c0_g1~~TRINITY_DN13660_c0_g1_i1.p1  ORF type:complete len:381 (+),score=85.15 TRINITY_DN13660_c0_g1_i1:128-1144(+)
MTVIITSDPTKATELVKKYNLVKAYSYDQFRDALLEGLFDALYIATPNWMHRQFAVPALEAGYHVLLEKPSEVSEEDALAICAAQQTTGARLMVAYRLHCEPATVEIINKVRTGLIGDPRYFSSVFSQCLKESNHRAKNGFNAGPIPDMGPYPINAVRNIFGMEPIEVYAVGMKSPGNDMNFHDTVSVTLRFPSERVAQFTVSYSSAPCETYAVVGVKGSVQAEPAFMFGPGKSISYRSTIEGVEESFKFKAVDQFAGETDYFSHCIISGQDPEPDGDEGWRDVRVICAIGRALETGEPQKLPPLESRRHAMPDQVREISFGRTPKEEDFVNCEVPAK